MNAARGVRIEHCVPASRAVCGLAATILLCAAGCVSNIARISSARNAVPVQQLPNELLAPARPALVPLDFRLLEQRPRETHIIDAGDTLGILIQGVLPANEEEVPKISTNNISSLFVYPATGQIHGPVVGVPSLVSAEGSLQLPLVGSLSMRGLTLAQAAEAIRKAYVYDRKILVPGRDTVIVALIKPRVHRIMVIREDIATLTWPTTVGHGIVPYTRRPPSVIVDLPTHQNDVLHALVVSGGMPGIDARSELWVLRGRSDAVRALPPVEYGLEGEAPALNPAGVRSLRIPLRLPAGEALPYQEQDIVLDDGDIVYVPARDSDMFYTGGLLVGGQFPMPRDRNLSVIEAMSIANGTVGGPAGLRGSALNFNNVGLGGLVNPTRILVLRKLPNGEEVKIAIDLSRAARDANENLIIQPNDFIMLQYKPSEYVANAVLSLVNPVVILAVAPKTTSNTVTSTTASGVANGGASTPPAAEIVNPPPTEAAATTQ